MLECASISGFIALLASYNVAGSYREIESGVSRKWYGALIGFVVMFVACGSQTYLVLIMMAGNIGIILACHRHIVQMVSLLWSWLWLLHHSVFGVCASVTGFQQVMALRLVGLASDLHTSHALKTGTLGPLDKSSFKILADVIEEPSVLDMLLYSFNFVGIQYGPYYRWKTFNDHIETERPETEASPEHNYRLITEKRVRRAVVYGFLYFALSYNYPAWYYSSSDFYSRSANYRFLYGLPQLARYILWVQFVSLMSGCVCSEAGFVMPKKLQPKPQPPPEPEQETTAKDEPDAKEEPKIIEESKKDGLKLKDDAKKDGLKSKDGAKKDDPKAKDDLNIIEESKKGAWKASPSAKDSPELGAPGSVSPRQPAVALTPADNRRWSRQDVFEDERIPGSVVQFDNEVIFMSTTMREALRGWDMSVQYWFWAHLYRKVDLQGYFAKMTATVAFWSIWHGLDINCVILLSVMVPYIMLEKIYLNKCKNIATCDKEKKLVQTGFYMMRLLCLVYASPCLVHYDQIYKFYNSIWWMFHLILGGAAGYLFYERYHQDPDTLVVNAPPRRRDNM